MSEANSQCETANNPDNNEDSATPVKRPLNQDSSSDTTTPPAAKRANLASMPTRQYLDKTVVPILLSALAALAKERPQEPVDYLVAYLQNHKHEHSRSNNNKGPNDNEVEEEQQQHS